LCAQNRLKLKTHFFSTLTWQRGRASASLKIQFKDLFIKRKQERFRQEIAKDQMVTSVYYTSKRN